MDSFDFKMRKPEQVVNSVMTKLKKHGKGIVLMHDFQTATSQAVPDLLAQLKAERLQDRAHEARKDPVKPLAEYDEDGQEGAEAADGQHASDLERGPHRRIAARTSNDCRGRPTRAALCICARADCDMRMPTMARPDRIEGLAIVSADGMIADAAGVQPDALKLEADQRFFHERLRAADVLVHGRNSGEGGARRGSAGAASS